MSGWLWWYWPFALAFIALVLFAIPEFIAFEKPSAGPTFSAFMWYMHTKWPLWTFLWGMLVGGLAVHFLWHWSPPGSINLGQLEDRRLCLARTDLTDLGLRKINGWALLDGRFHSAPALLWAKVG